MVHEENRARSVCFTGHRPEKLTCVEQQVKKRLEAKICQAIADGLDVFITGMARGVDIWAAQIVLKLRSEGCAIKLICSSPYDGFEKSWSKEWQEQYRAVLSAADHVEFICSGYSRSCFQIRNKWMVDHAARVIAVFNGGKGGTKNTIDYAAKVSVPVVYI